MLRVTSWGAGVVLGPALVLLVAGPAAAHDRVVPASPVLAQTLPEPPSQVRLTLSGQPRQALGQVVVTDGAGQPRGVGALALEGTQVVQALDGGGAPGQWRAAYRVVSSDGHPISGEWTFTVQAAVPTAPASSPPAATPGDEVTTQDPTQDPTVPQSAAPPATDPLTAGPAATPAGQDQAGSGVGAGWVATGVAGVAVAAGAAALVRGRQARRAR